MHRLRQCAMNPRVRAKIDLYRQMARAAHASLTIPVPETGAAHAEAEWNEREGVTTVNAAVAGLVIDVPLEHRHFKKCLEFLLNPAINVIAEAYRDVTDGKSLTTWDPVTGKNIFSTFV